MTRDTRRQQKLREQLLQQRELILNRGRLERDDVRAEAETVRSNVFDEAEASTFGLQVDLDLALLELSSEALRQIDYALERIDAGTYGVCEDCGLEIPAARLRALPSAECCRDCADARELNSHNIRLLGVSRLSAMPFAGGQAGRG
jgi:DnaK suppressor protein